MVTFNKNRISFEHLTVKENEWINYFVQNASFKGVKAQLFHKHVIVERNVV